MVCLKVALTSLHMLSALCLSHQTCPRHCSFAWQPVQELRKNWLSSWQTDGNFYTLQRGHLNFYEHSLWSEMSGLDHFWTFYQTFQGLAVVAFTVAMTPKHWVISSAVCDRLVGLQPWNLSLRISYKYPNVTNYRKNLTGKREVLLRDWLCAVNLLLHDIQIR